MASPTIVSYANQKLKADTTSSFLTTDITVTFQDLDAPDILKYSITPRLNTLGGTLSLSSQDDSGAGTVGYVSYNYSLASANVKSLADGQVAYQVFTVTATDNAGNAKSQDIVITITGTNDAPLVSYRAESQTKEGAASYTLDLLMDAKDLDGDTLSVKSLTYTVDNGTAQIVDSTTKFISLDSKGVLTVNPSDTYFDTLASGTTRSILLNYLVSDGKGGDTPQSQTIVVAGTNDAPIVGKPLTDSVSKGSAIALDLLKGTTDVDVGDNLYLATVNFTVDGKGVGGATPQGLSLNGNSLLVDAANSAFSNLYDGQSSTIKVNYLIKDSFGASVAQSETITINGTGVAPKPVNNAPTVGYLQEVKVVEGDAKRSLDLLMGAKDLDGDTLSVKSLNYAVDNGITQSIDSTTKFISLDSKGVLTVNPSDTYFDTLASGTTRSILLNYLVSDGKGGDTPQSQSIVVTGVNDAPTLTVDSNGSTSLSALVVKGTKSEIDLLQGARDIDTGDNLHIENVSYTVNGKNVGGATPVGLSFNGKSLTVDASNPAFSGVFRDTPSMIKVDYLIKDSFGASVKQSDIITISSNDAAPNLMPINKTASISGLGIAIDGSAKVGNVLVANTSQLLDLQGHPLMNLSYQWFIDGKAAGSNATNSSYQVGTLDAGHFISVDVSISGQPSVVHVTSDPLFGYA